MLKNNKPTEMLKKNQLTTKPQGKQPMAEVKDSWEDGDFNVTLPKDKRVSPVPVQAKSATQQKSSVVKVSMDSDNEEPDSEGEDSDNDEEESEGEDEPDDEESEEEEESDEEEEESDEEEEESDEDEEEESDEDEEEESDEDEEEEEDKPKYEFIESFDEMTNLNLEVLHGIYTRGIEKPVASQVLIDSLIKYKFKNAVIDASTGSGKTIAFGAVVTSLVRVKVKCLQFVIIAPTHDLAFQIYEEICSLVVTAGISVALHRGAGNFKEGQAPGDRDTSRTYLTNSKKNVLGKEQIIIGTPGKILSLFTKRTVFDKRCVQVPNFEQSKNGLSVQLPAGGVQGVVLDEGDELLKKASSKFETRGMCDDVMSILDGIKAEQPSARFLLYSATAAQDTAVEDFMHKYNAELFSFKVKRSPNKSVSHRYVTIEEESEKAVVLVDLLQRWKDYSSVFAFCGSKLCADYMYRVLSENGFQVGKASSSMTQIERDGIMRDFKTNNIKILVATDVCARGIDVPSVDLVINVDIPDAVAYAHRAGRCGRLNRTGTCVTLVLNIGKDIPARILGIQSANNCLFNVLSNDVMNSSSKTQTKF